jgi:thioesterase domain-containing protein/acyl carrier protein
MIMSETIPPRTNLEKEIADIWAQVLHRSPIGIRENFFELGGTSVQAVRIFARIEQVVHQRLPLSLILGAPTIEQLASELLPGKFRDRKAFVVPIQSEGEKPTFFCIGAGVLWRPVSARLGPDQPVFNIGLDPRALEQMKGPNSFEKLARHMVSALCEQQPQGPYYLGGFCNDGIFAYEVARQLAIYGHEVGLLALVETRNPSPNFKRRMVNGLRRSAIQAEFQRSQFYHMIRTRDISQYLQDRRAQLRRFRLRVLSSVFPGFRLRARQSGQVDSWESTVLEAGHFRPKPIACPTVIFRCADWPTISAGDPYFGWRELLMGPSETYEIPGDHMGIFRDPSVGVLAENLKACLRRATQGESPEFDMCTDVDQRLYLGHSRT